MSPIKAHAAFSTAVPSGGDTLPDSIQWMPPGKHSITAMKDGEPFDMEIEVNEALAQRVAAMLDQYRDKASRAEGDLPFFDFNHHDAEASAHPLQMYWAGDDPRHGGIRARLQWTGAGADAIQRRTFRRFSPEFLIDDNQNVIGVGINMGGLVNRAAFRKIQPIWSRDAVAVPGSGFQVPSCSGPGSITKPGTRNSEPGTALANAKRETRNSKQEPPMEPPMDPSQINLSHLTTAIAQLTETMTAQGSELKAIQARLAAHPTQHQSAPTNAHNVAGRAQAERSVAAAAAEGKFPPQDQELLQQLVEVFTANPDAGKFILARMPANPALQSVVTPGAASHATFGPTEPATQFAALVKARAGQFNNSRCRALDAAIIERPDLYKAWRDANGQPLL